MDCQQMTVGEFRNRFKEIAQKNVQCIISFSDFLRHKTEQDKEYREEWIPIFAYLKHQLVPDSSTIRLGGKKERWDALVDEELYIEVTQALPEKAHEVRRALADGGLTPDLWIAHAFDHLQIPDVAIERIKAKNALEYPSKTVLLVNVLGEDSREDDELIKSWIKRIRRRTGRGRFAFVYLVEAARYKLFQIF